MAEILSSSLENNVVCSTAPQSKLTVWTTPGRKRVGIRASLIQLGLMSGCRKRKWTKKGLRLVEQCEIRDCCAHRALSPTQHLGSCCFTGRTDCVLSRQNAGWGAVDSVFLTSMLADVKPWIWWCRPHHHHHLVAVVHKHPGRDSEDALRVYVYLYINNCIYVM